MAQFYCEKCRKTMDEKQFYGSNNLEKYPEGKLRQCKQCITMHVDNWDPDTYLWILQECDVPYIPEEWNKLLASYGKDRSRVTGMTILGRYLSKMKLKQFKDHRWKDTAYLQEVADKRTEEAMKRQGFSASEIDQALEQGRVPIPEGELEIPQYEDSAEKGSAIAEDYVAQPEIEIEPLDLTDEDKRYLLLKWGKMYRPDEWVWLEKLYNEMMASYDIQTAGHIDNLKKLCKTSLKAEQLLDIGDIEGAQKAIKMYDVLMKSGKFTAAQNKDAQGEFVDSVGEIVALCEQEGFIPRYYTDGPQDKVDYTIRDMQRYTRTLVTEEMHLGELIEQAIKNNEREDAQKEVDIDLDEDSDIENIERSLRDEDFQDYHEFLEENAAMDEDTMQQLENYADDLLEGVGPSWH